MALVLVLVPLPHTLPSASNSSDSPRLLTSPGVQVLGAGGRSVAEVEECALELEELGKALQGLPMVRGAEAEAEADEASAVCTIRQ